MGGNCMSFCGSEDKKLNKMLIEIGELMNEVLDQIEVCDNNDTDFDTRRLRRDVERFVEDWC